MDKQAIYLQRIHRSYPNLEVKTARLTEGGDFNDILIVNETLIFRFPRSVEGIERIEIEMAVLQAIQGRITLQVPNPTFASEVTRTVGEVFMGYEMIPGEQLQHHLETIAHNSYVRQKLADQLVTFLRELHGVPVNALGLDLPVHDHDRPEGWARMYKAVREYLFPYMRADARDTVRGQFDAFLNNPGRFDYKHVIRHGDFGPGNILLDPKTETVSGVIDFGSAGLDDSAVDLGFVSFWWEAILEESFLERVHSGYPGMESLLNRIQFYKTAIALQLALGGLQSDDRDAFERGLAPYR